MLSACAPVEAPVATQWDGRWVGHFESSLGLLGCPSRGVLDLRIENGVMAGGGNAGPVVIAIRGGGTATGEITNRAFGRDGLAAAVMAGTFTRSDAAGRCQGTTCEGNWSLQRFSQRCRLWGPYGFTIAAAFGSREVNEHIGDAFRCHELHWIFARKGMSAH